MQLYWSAGNPQETGFGPVHSHLPRPGDANVLTGFPLLSLNFKDFKFVKIANWRAPALAYGCTVALVLRRALWIGSRPKITKN